MGKTRSYEIKEYRQKIMDILCESDRVCTLLGVDKKEAYHLLPFHKSFPHEWIPDVQTQTDRFINFEISATKNVINDVFKDITIYFFVVCHKDIARWKDDFNDEYDDDIVDLWYDEATCALDDIFNDKRTDDLGFGIVGTMELISNKPYVPQEKYRGRILTFKVRDFENGKKYGK